MVKKLPELTLEECKASAAPHDKRSDWHKSSPRHYLVAGANDWRDDCCSHMPMRKRFREFTLEECKASSAPHQSRVLWSKASLPHYQSACRQGFSDACCEHMPEVVFVRVKPLKIKPTFEECKASSALCTTRTEWRLKHASHYKEASNKGWREICCGHMEVWKPKD